MTEKSKITVSEQLRRAILNYRVGILQPSAILMHPKTFYELFIEVSYHSQLSDIAPGATFYGITIYRTTEVETFKIL